ncbi:MAG TPA: DUF2332 domain-containing protein [Burkholderiaceae bacterium]|nr:DUF2332 domain-containing protein [Burkholderiaceae bacterium]
MTDAAALARRFTQFADHECRDDPLYVALCRLIAARPAALVLLQRAPVTQRVPNVLLAALHDRVLAGTGHAFAAYFPSIGGNRAPDAPLAAAFDDFMAVQAGELAALVESRHTQTNEIGRCAVLWPALCALAARGGQRRLALLDFGCSAGLNLAVDRYRYDYGAFTLGALAAPDVPTISCHPVGVRTLGLRDCECTAPQLVTRTGIDPAPVDVADAAQVRWLRACVWPYDRERAMRLQLALAIAQRERFGLRCCSDCTASIAPWLDTLPGDALPVVLNSWVLHYLEPAARAAHIAAMRELVQRRGVYWLSAEGVHIRIGEAPSAPPLGDAIVDDRALANGSQWWLTSPGAGAPALTLLARSHPHGRWLQWQ